MGRHEVIDCDRCGEEEVEHSVSFGVYRESAGDYLYIDLCIGCAGLELAEFVGQLDPDARREWYRAVARGRGE